MQRFRRFENIDFDVEDKERSGALKKLEDGKLETLLHEDSFQTLSELAESLGVDHTTVSKRLKALRMIQKQGHWVPYQLKPSYDLKKITIPMMLFYSANDMIVTDENVLELGKRLPNVLVIEKVPYKLFNHFDFGWAIDAKTLLYDRVLELMQKFDVNNNLRI